MSVSLEVTPGFTFVDVTNVDAAALNAGARPLVEVPNGSLPPEVLQMAPLLLALLSAGADTLRGRSFLTKGNFWAEDWATPEGVSVPAGGAAENAAEWTMAPAGGAVTVGRAQDSPDSMSTWCAQLTGSTGVTSADFYTFVPSGIAGSLRDATLTFSVWVKNLYSSAAQAQAFISPAGDLNSRNSVRLADNSALQSFPAGAWTRLVWTFDTSAYSNLANGFRIGIRTAALDSALKSMLLAQAQLEAATVASSFIRPAGGGAGSGFRVPVMTAAERARGFRLLAQLATGEWRTMENPKSEDAYIGFNPAIGAPQWEHDNFTTYPFSGSEYIITIPEDGVIEVHCWGAGAGIEEGYPGGVGGYTWARLPVEAGEQFTAVVGQCGGFGITQPVFGFGGRASNISCGGGGLTGLFTGTTPLLAAEQSRALIIAGGGGGVSYNNFFPTADPIVAGGNGNDPGSSGGETTMLGQDAPPNGNGGGGGHYGGGPLGYACRGGAGYIHTDTTDGAALFTARTTPVTPGQLLTVPGNTSQYYQDNAGRPGNDGLMVIVWNPA